MRRISLALALVGAVAAAGCGGAGGTSPASSGGNKGVDQASFKLVVVGEGTPTWDAATSTTVVIPKGGVVTGGGINCGVDGTGAHTTCQVLIPYNTTAVALTATPLAPYAVWGWAGACGGTGACSVVMTDTRTIAIRFATSTAGLGAHPPFTDPAIHGPEWMKNFQSPVPAGTYTCSASNCHGPQLLGVALAPACNKCHMMPHTGAASYGTYGQTTHPADYATAALLSAGSQNCFDCHSGTNFMGAKTAGLAPGAPYRSRVLQLPHHVRPQLLHAPGRLRG